MNLNLTYLEMLQFQEWKDKRIQILSRDRSICQKCRNASYEKYNFYGPFVFNITAPIQRKYFKAFNGFAGGIVVADLEVYNHKAVMLYLIRNLCENGKNNSDRYVIGAARKLSIDERKYYFPNHVKGQFDIYHAATDYLIQTRGGGEYTPTPIVEDISIKPLPHEEVWLFAKDLNIHHTYYRIDKLPWEYPDESLQTLCRSCHNEVHRTESIPVLDENNQLIGEYKPCGRCNGAGWFPEYSYYKGGICFACSGKRYLSNEFVRK